MEPKTIEWNNNSVKLIDQTKLPHELIFIYCSKWQELYDAIKTMKIRGAPAIGIAGAYAFCLAALELKSLTLNDFKTELLKIANTIKEARPTAVNLSWAINRMQTKFLELLKQDISINEIINKLIEEAINIDTEDALLCKKIGEYGERLIPDKANILTHCNAGGLATSTYGTALGVIKSAYLKGKNIHVWIDETRPLLQGARLTAWELKNYSIPCTLITDNTAGYLMSKGQVDLVIVGADRIASNGDTANKIGTYTLAVLCKEHNIPFYIAAPYSTIDLNISNGSQINIEYRSNYEVSHINNKPICPEDINILNPAFDITPAKYIKAFITNKGIINPPFSNI